MHERVIRAFVVAALMVLAASLLLFASDREAAGSYLEKNRILVEAFDKDGKFLRNGVGFVYDESTVICSYGTVQGASVIKAQIDDLRSYTNRMVSSNRRFDLAVLRTNEEIPEASILGSSDGLAAGDAVYVFVRQKSGGWRLSRGRLKGWVDSGKGYEVAQLILDPLAADARFEPSPLLTATGNIVGWFSPVDSSAISLRSISEFLQEKTASVSFTDLERTRFWVLPRIKATAGAGEPVKLDGTQTYAGTKRYPFKLDLPDQWNVQTMMRGQHLLLLADDARFGISLGLRVIPRPSDDLRIAVDQTETLIFPSSTRIDMVPYSSQRNFSGFKATYEDTDVQPEIYASTIFYSIVGDNFYVLSVTYPQTRRQELQAWVDQIFSSLRLP